MNFESKYIDELIELRRQARMWKMWSVCDEIRNYLDEKLVFVFDTKDNDGKYFQEVWYMTEKSINRKNDSEKTKDMTNRKYIEFLIKEDARLEAVLEAWIYSNSSRDKYV